MVTPTFLRSASISFQVECQPPGTLVYVRTGVYHKVLNTGVLLMEAVNVGSSCWNAVPYQPHCGCPSTAIQPISRNPTSGEITCSRRLAFYECPVDGCVNVAPTAIATRSHSRSRMANPGPELMRHACQHYSAVYVGEAALARDVSERHPAGPVAQGRSLYDICNTLVRPSYLNRHRRQCQGSQVACDECQRKFHPGGLESHRARCPSVIRIMAVALPRVLGGFQRRGYALHGSTPLICVSVCGRLPPPHRWKLHMRCCRLVTCAFLV